MASSEYELMYILNPDLESAEEEQQSQRIRNFLTQNGGTIVSESRWGKRPLAYDIKKKREGIYVYLIISMTSEGTLQIGRLLQTEPNVLRHILVKIIKAKRAEDARIAQLGEARRAQDEAVASRSVDAEVADDSEDMLDMTDETEESEEATSEDDEDSEDSADEEEEVEDDR